MRILHTSDWHLGRSFGQFSLADDQRAFTDWFVGQCTAQRADLVIIAGDIYDRAVAPVEAIAHFREVLAALLAAGVQVAVITGNHDGADRVAPYDDLLDLSRLYLRGGYGAVGEVLTLACFLNWVTITHGVSNIALTARNFIMADGMPILIWKQQKKIWNL